MLMERWVITEYHYGEQVAWHHVDFPTVFPSLRGNGPSMDAFKRREIMKYFKNGVDWEFLKSVPRRFSCRDGDEFDRFNELSNRICPNPQAPYFGLPVHRHDSTKAFFAAIGYDPKRRRLLKDGEAPK